MEQLCSFNFIFHSITGVYDSSSCRPSTDYECELLHHFAVRTKHTVKQQLSLVIPDGKRMKTDQGLLDWLKVKLMNNKRE